MSTHAFVAHIIGAVVAIRIAGRAIGVVVGQADAKVVACVGVVAGAMNAALAAERTRWAETIVCHLVAAVIARCATLARVP